MSDNIGSVWDGVTLGSKMKYISYNDRQRDTVSYVPCFQISSSIC